jgi:hypothetical protein
MDQIIADFDLTDKYVKVTYLKKFKMSGSSRMSRRRENQAICYYIEIPEQGGSHGS